MQIIHNISDLQAARAAMTGRVGTAFTMGALHTGHLELAKQARGENDHVITTIFVNPTQFAPTEDLSTYPRTHEKDIDLLAQVGVDIVFMPDAKSIYPAGFQTYVEVGEIAQGLEGSRRRGHFRGVATVVTKLFNLTQGHNTYFGQKDAQQVAVLKTLIRDFNINIALHVIPTVREEDGLAMSSRNAYLTPYERKAAPSLYRGLQTAAELYANGERHPKTLRREVQKSLVHEPLLEMDYVSAANAITLEELHDATEEPILLSLAARVGKARLIDNVLLPLTLNTRADLTRVLGGQS
jgi:pantoate--beta-alanine ligase